MKAKLIRHGHSYALLKDGKLIAFAHPEDFSNDHTIGKLSLKNCQAIERGYDLDEIAKNCSKQEYYDWGGEVFEQQYLDTRYSAYKEGFQKALEILGDKKFSEKEMQRAMNWIMTQYFEFHEQPTMGRREHYIQSIQQTEWDCIVEMEEIQEIYRDGTTKYERVPKLDADGCLILKRK